MHEIVNSVFTIFCMWPFSNFHENQVVQPVHDKLRATANICLGFCTVAMKSATEVREIRNESMR